MNILLIDFGASRIKSSLYDSETEILSDVFSTPGTFFSKMSTVTLKYINERFHEHLNYHHDIDKIAICSEMHGFILSESIPPSEEDLYISWRADLSHNKKKDIQSYDSSLLSITGINDKLGLPRVNINYHQNYNKKSHLLSLIDAIILLNGTWNSKTSIHLAAATGLFDIWNNKWIKSLDKTNIITYDVSSYGDSLGFINYSKKNIPVFGGLGDLQAAIMSIDLSSSINVNMGTGSQISMEYSPNLSYEIRPYMHKKFINTLTHLPCGRVLNEYASYVDSLFDKNIDSVFWNKLFKTSIDINHDNEYEINLNIIRGLYGYIENKSITSIDNINRIDDYIYSIKKALANQYVCIINDIKRYQDISKIYVTGVLGMKIPEFCEVLEYNTNLKVERCTEATDSTIIGLKNYCIAHKL